MVQSSLHNMIGLSMPKYIQGKNMLANPTVLLALLFAVGAGIAISIQSTFITASTTSLQPVQLAFWVQIGGAIVGAIMLVIMRTRGEVTLIPDNATKVMGMVLTAGGLAMLIVPAVALSFPTLGLVAGEVAIITGQTLVALVVDTLGLAGGEPIPLDWQRLAGLVLMAVAVYLLLPKTHAT